MPCGHPCDCPTYRDHVLSVGFSMAAMPTRHPEVARIDKSEVALDKDRDGYKEMRDGGLQPKRIDGSGELVKRVNNQFDIDLGRIVPKNEESRVREGYAIAAEMGFS